MDSDDYGKVANKRERGKLIVSESRSVWWGDGDGPMDMICLTKTARERGTVVDGVL